MQLHLTRRGSYGIRAMVALAGTPNDARLSVRSIAAEQAIPAAFLPRVMTDLVRARLVVATTGRAGGYRLAREAASISILDIVRAVEGPDEERGCILRNAACLAGGECSAHSVVADARAALVERLGTSTLASLAGT